MDPWSKIDLRNGRQVLFGFAVLHPETGGRSWTCSTTVTWCSDAVGVAGTESERVYTLGRQFRVSDLPLEGEEAWVACSLLLGAAGSELILPINVDRWLDPRWLASCKVARHLDLSAPRRRSADVETFLDAHMQSYVLKRQMQVRS